jgi:hypothetical protein
MSYNKIVDPREDKTDEAVFMEEVRANYDLAESYEEDNRRQAIDDLENLDGRQWPEKIAAQRDKDGRPTLTINKLQGFVDGVKGDIRLGEMQIKVQATQPAKEGQKHNIPAKLAEIYNGLIRQIERLSNAKVARTTASDAAVQNAFGFYEVVSDFVDDDTFDQELRTRRIKDQFSVLLDPLHNEIDGRDSRWGFKSVELPRDDFKVQYPDIEPSEFKTDYAANLYRHWITAKWVRVAVYWVKRPFKRKLVAVRDKDGFQSTYDAVEWDKIKDELKAKEQIVHLMPDEQGIVSPIPGPAPEGSGLEEVILNQAPVVVRERDVESHVVVKYIVDGTQIIDGPKDDNGKIILNFKTVDDIKKRTVNNVTGEIESSFRKFVWPGKYIPLIPVWGKELQIGGKTKRRSLIRFAKDPQRNYNYHVTAETERTALAKVPPAILTAKQLGKNIDMWRSTANHKYLLYEPDPRPGAVPPYFPSPPQASSGNALLTQQATQDMKDTMSIQDSSLGISSGREVSGRAKEAEQRKNDVANFEFADNLRHAIKFEGDIYIDLIPHVYDTERVIMVLNEAGEEEFVTINQRIKDEDTDEMVTLNDMTQGKYLVTVTTGPNFTTQRIETREALSGLASAVKHPVAGLILLTKIVKNMDWAGATETAEQLEKMLPPGIIEEKDENGNPVNRQDQGQEGGQEGGQNPAQLRMELMKAAADLQGVLLSNDKKQLDIDKAEAEQGKGVQALQATLDRIAPLLQQIQGGGV